jgi:hypothetical protein
MMLSCIEPTDPGYEKRSFSCAACRYQCSVTFGIDGVPVLVRSPAAEGTVTPSRRVGHRDDGSPMAGATDLVSGPSTSDDVTLH